MSVDIPLLSLIVNAPDFSKTWFELGAERDALVNKRTELETDLAEVRNKIAHLDAVLDHLAPLANLPWDDNIVGLGITDAIRRVLQDSSERLSAQEVRQRLIEKGYNLSELTAPMASIYKVLSRLEESKEIEKEKEGSKVFYAWIRTPISDEDIPF